jgi:hypothetical protein
MFVKLLARARWIAQDRAVHSGLMSAGSEALRVSRAIFQSMQQQALADGASFALVILPIEDRWLNKSVRTADVEAWNKMVSFICAEQLTCVDLLPALLALPRADVDRALDGWHFGPRMNRRIAAWMEEVVKSVRARIALGD